MAKIDPITREIIHSALASAADEMAVGLYRTAYSTIVRDALDFSTSLCNGAGEQIAQGTTIPLHMGAVPFAMRGLFSRFSDDDIKPGDVFILNDPFDGGMHIPDIFIVKPVFAGVRRIAFAVSTAHHLDLGGRVPGSSACDNTEIYHDGIRIPWLKLHHEGEPDEGIYSMIRANVRVPDMTIGDLRAQLAACHTGEMAVCDIVERYGADTFDQCTRELLDYTERLVRSEIAEWPDGESTFVDYMDSDGCGGERVRIQCTITVHGDSLTADLTGSSPQVAGAINSTLSYTTSAVGFCVRAVIKSTFQSTEGMFRPLNVVVARGSVLDGEMPAASSMRGVTGFRTVDAVMGALAGIVPERCMAASEGGNSLVIIGGQRKDNAGAYVYYELLSGTWGARPDQDGNDGLCNPSNVSANIPIEEAESNYPVRIERYGLVSDTGGAGRFRGGVAIEREWRLLEGDAKLTIRSDRRDHLPYGLKGGEAGRGSINVLHHADHEEILPVMVSTSMRAGERIYHRQPGGGGYGHPFERDPEDVAADVKNGFVSVQKARTDYGVVIDEESGELDNTATRDARAALGTDEDPGVS